MPSTDERAPRPSVPRPGRTYGYPRPEGVAGPRMARRRARPRRRRRILTVVAGTLAGVLALTAMGAWAAYRQLQGNIRSQDAFGQLTNRPAAGPTTALNILLIGSDTRAGADAAVAGVGNVAGARSDTTILLHLSADRQRAALVSIPRDSWVTIPSCRTNNGQTAPQTTKFNAAFSLGGPSCTIQTVESLTGVRIDHFVVIDFAGFKDMVNALGGVPICEPRPLRDPMSGLNIPAGTSTLNGDQALAFVRARYALGNGSDLQRIDRQQQFLASMVRKVSSGGLLLNPVRLFQFLSAATKSVTTDPGLSGLNDLRRLAQSVQNLQPGQVSFLTVPVVDRGDGANVLWVPAASKALFDAIRADQPLPGQPGAAGSAATPGATPGTSQPPLQTPPSRISVRVLNGTGQTGLAARAATDLRAQGFQVVGIGNADKTSYATSVVRYDPAYDQSARTLTAAVPGATSEQDLKLTNTLVLVVGANYTGAVPVTVGNGRALPSDLALPAAAPTPTPTPRSAADATCG